jgi:hypothetical protein
MSRWKPSFRFAGGRCDTAERPLQGDQLCRWGGPFSIAPRIDPHIDFRLVRGA